MHQAGVKPWTQLLSACTVVDRQHWLPLWLTCRAWAPGHQLTAPIVFTSLALFNVLIAPLNSFPWVINGVVEAAVSLRRLRRCSWQDRACVQG